MSIIPKNDFISNNCRDRVRPTMLRDVKTEALLVFCRTALERYFAKVDEANYKATVGSNADTDYVYNTLRSLLEKLQDSVVNVDYFIDLVQLASTNPLFNKIAKSEEALINYYDAMAKVTQTHYQDKPAYLPEFLVICILENWIGGGEHSTHLYPFLNEIDFLELMSKFEENREYFKNGDACTVKEIHQLSDKITHNLQEYKYKVNKKRVSKTRTRSKR